MLLKELVEKINLTFDVEWLNWLKFVNVKICK